MRISVCLLDAKTESAIHLLMPPPAEYSDTSNLPAIRKGSTYLWAIYGGRDLMLSGLANTQREVELVAEQYGLQIDFRPKAEDNEDFVYTAKSKSSRYPLISSIKRQSGKYTLAAWHSWVEYVAGIEPFAFEDHDSEESLKAKAIAYSGEKNPYVIKDHDGIEHINNNSYAITNYIRRKEAQRKFATPSSSTTTGNVEFVYANYNLHRYAGNKSDWKRHRIIKKTDKHIFIDRYPFCGKGYLRSGWRAMVVFSSMLDRAELEKERSVEHKASGLHFYSDKNARRTCKQHFIEGGAFNNPVIELPVDEVGWAQKFLGIINWPATFEEIKKAYGRAAMKHHPDRGGTHQGFIECGEARDFLMDMIAV